MKTFSKSKIKKKKNKRIFSVEFLKIRMKEIDKEKMMVHEKFIDDTIWLSLIHNIEQFTIKKKACNIRCKSSCIFYN